MTRFYRIQGRTDTRLGDRTRWINTVSYGSDMQRFSLGSNLAIRVNQNPLTVRSDFRTKVHDKLTVVAGVDTMWTQVSATVKAPPIPEDGEVSGPVFGRQSNRQS